MASSLARNATTVIAPQLDRHNGLVYTREQLEMIAESGSDLVNQVFKRVPDTALDELEAIARRSTVITIYEIGCNAAFNGGVLFKINGKFLKETKHNAIQEPYIGWSRELQCHLNSFGVAFTVTEEHDVLYGVPRLIPMRLLSFGVHENIYGHRYYVVYPRRNSGFEASFLYMSMKGSSKAPIPGLYERPLKGIYVFEDPRYSPDGQGNLHSRLLSLRYEIDYLHNLYEENRAGVRLAVHPAVAIEQETEPYDPKNLKWVGPENPDEVYTDGDKRKTMEISPTGYHTLQQYINDAKFENDYGVVWERFDSFLRQFSLSEDGSCYRPLKGKGGIAYRNNPLGVGTMFLNAKQKAGTVIQGQQVQDLDKFRASVEETVGALFNVPRSRFAQAERGKTTSNDSENDKTFEDNQEALKKRMMPFIHKMFCLINRKKEEEFSPIGDSTFDCSEDMLSDSDNDGDDGTDANASGSDDEDNEVFTTESSVEVFLPSKPPPGELRQLRIDGVIKHDAYRHMVAARYGIPVSWTNEMPELTLQEINGIAPTVESSTVTSQSKQSNSTTGTAKATGTTVTKTGPPETGVGSKYDKKQQKANKPLNNTADLKRRKKK